MWSRFLIALPGPLGAATLAEIGVGHPGDAVLEHRRADVGAGEEDDASVESTASLASAVPNAPA